MLEYPYPGCYPGLYSDWAFSPSLRRANTSCLIVRANSSSCYPSLNYLEMMYLVVENSVNESNNESNRKHENVHVINRNQGTQAFWQKKRKEMRCNPSPTLHQKREIVTMLSVFLDRTECFSVKYLMQYCLFFLCFFVIKK